MKTSKRIYLLFKRLIGILGSFIGFFLWQWVFSADANNEEHLRECNEKYVPNAFVINLGLVNMNKGAKGKPSRI